jgi:hypothetical protein
MMVKKRNDEVIYRFELEYIKEQLLDLKYVLDFTIFAIIFLLVVMGILILRYRGVCSC